MSIICYRMDGCVKNDQNVTGLPDTAVKRSPVQSARSMKRKNGKRCHSSGSKFTHSRESIVSSDSDKGTSTMPQKKQPSSPAVLGVQTFQKQPSPAVQTFQKQSSPAVQTFQKTEKKAVLPHKVKADPSHIDYKRREFQNFRKQFIQQQNIYLKMYAELRDLEASSGTHGTGEDVRLLLITGWPVHDLLLLMPEEAATRNKAEVKGVLGPKILQQLSLQLTRIPDEVKAMGATLMSRRMEILECMRKNRNVLVHDSNNKEWQTMKAEFEEETEKLRRLVSVTAKSIESKITQSLDVTKIPWIDRDIMIKKIEALQKELHIYKKGNKGDDSGKIDKNQDQNLKLQKALEELCRERSARNTLKEMFAAAEGKLASTRLHTNELERQLNATRAELTAAQRRLDNFKQLHQYRAPGCDAHSKKFRQGADVPKNGEITIEVLSRQRDALEIRIRELEQEATVLMREAESRETELSCQVECLRKKLDERILERESAEARAQELEQSLKHVQEQYTLLRERSRELVTLHQQKVLDFLPRKGQCSVEEIDIWNDLQATKDALGRVKQELERSRVDKDSLLQSLANIAPERSQDEMIQLLLSRECIIRRMQNNIEELNEDKKTMEKNLSSYENQLATLRFEINLLRSLNSYKSDSVNIPNEELEREVLDLYQQIVTLKRERAALASENVSHAMLLERYDRCADLFARVTRVRREIAAQIEGTAVPVMEEAASHDHEVLSSLAKAYESSAHTWSALRVERARVLNLEDTVCSQRQQLDRENLLRVQHEQRRAYLERELILTWAGNTTQNTDIGVADVLYTNKPT